MENTWYKHLKRVCAFNLFSTCNPSVTITLIPRVFHVAVPVGNQETFTTTIDHYRGDLQNLWTVQFSSVSHALFCLVSSQQTHKNCITFEQRRPWQRLRRFPNIVQMLYKYFVFAGSSRGQLFPRDLNVSTWFLCNDVYHNKISIKCVRQQRIIDHVM